MISSVFAIVFIGSIIMLLGLTAVGVFAFYSIRRKEIGDKPAIRETEIAVIEYYSFW